jgi:CP family cyanate transporter-like MFS transporter
MFCLVSPFAATIAGKFGLERTLFGTLVIILAGIALRSAGPVWSLFAGTCILGVGIAIGNTLVPGLLKRDFPNHITKLTAIYALTMGIASGFSSAIVVPIAQATNWQVALGIFALFPIISALVWLPQLRSQASTVTKKSTVSHGNKIWHSGLAWQVTMFMGTTSLTYYIIAAWLPAILVSNGYSQATAGSLHGFMQLASAFPGLILIPLLSKTKDQRIAVIFMSGLAIIALLGLQLAPSLAMLWIPMFGFGNSGAFILALSFMGLRTTSPLQAAALSGMAQSIGYMMAATGPIMIGALHDLTNGWQMPLYTCLAFGMINLAFGVCAGRAVQIPAEPEAPPAR